MEADLSRLGVRLRDLCHPPGHPDRVRLREVLWLIRYLPRDSAISVAQGGDGFSMTDLLVMESSYYGGGQANERHPSLWAQRNQGTLIQQRQAALAAQASAQGGHPNADGSDEKHDARDAPGDK